MTATFKEFLLNKDNYISQPADNNKLNCSDSVARKAGTGVFKRDARNSVPVFHTTQVEEQRDIVEDVSEDKPSKTIAFTFGRMNPPTIGHGVLLDKLAQQGTEYKIYLSKTQDKKKNPLTFEQKLKYAKEMFPKHSKHFIISKAKTAIDVLVELYDDNYTDVIMVVGSDRVKEFDTLLKTYNGITAKHGYYSFNSITVESAGDRDPDSDGVEGMSASKMRQAVVINDKETFKMGVPEGFDYEELWNDLKTGMGIQG